MKKKIRKLISNIKNSGLIYIFKYTFWFLLVFTVIYYGLSFFVNEDIVFYVYKEFIKGRDKSFFWTVILVSTPLSFKFMIESFKNFDKNISNTDRIYFIVTDVFVNLSFSLFNIISVSVSIINLINSSLKWYAPILSEFIILILFLLEFFISIKISDKSIKKEFEISRNKVKYKRDKHGGPPYSIQSDKQI